MQKITFENLPSTNTPLNATNMNLLQTNVENAINGIVESGSNTNGDYVKYADGTMICWKQVSGTINITTTWGEGYTTGSTNTLALGSWAETFYATPTVSAIVQRGGLNSWLGSIQSISTTSAGNACLLRFTSGSNVTYTIHVVGYGRWKA